MLSTAAKAIAMQVPAIANVVHARDDLLRQVAELTRERNDLLLQVAGQAKERSQLARQVSELMAQAAATRQRGLTAAVTAQAEIAQSVEHVSNVQLSTPIPDPELIFLVNGHRDLHAFDISRRATVTNIISLLSDASIDYRRFQSVLDFGCGCGRVLAGWEGVLPPGVRLFGCDVNEALIDFCQKNILFAETTATGYFPPLPYQTGQFDFIYAASVYTHLTLPALLQWTGEFARICRQSGVVMVSHHGSYYAPELARLSREGSAALARRGYYVHLHGDERETWHGSNYYATFLSSEFMFNLFHGFELVKAFPGVSHGPNPFASFQDILIFRRLSD